MTAQVRLSALPASDDVLRVPLDNGIVVLARANFNSPSVVVKGYFHSGTLYDPDGMLGLSNFTAAALMRGTHHHDYDGIYDALETVGAKMGFGANTHTCSLSGKALVEDLDLLLSLMADSLRFPTFPEQEVERLRAQIMTGFALRAQSPEAMAEMKFDEMLYQGHPYSRDGDGHPETVAAITQADLVNFHRHHYGPAGMVVVVVGGVEPAEAVQKVKAVLGDWENPSQAPAAVLPVLKPVEKTSRMYVPIPEKSQASLIMGVAGPPRCHPLFQAALLGNNVFGQFGMYGRIGEVIRERAGLAYFAYSSLSGGMGPGPWSVSAGVDIENLEAAENLIHQEIARFVNDGVTPEELADSKANFVGSLPLSLESNSGVAGAILNTERYGLGLDYYLGYADQIQAVSLLDVQQVVQEFWNPEKLVISASGPPR